MTAGGDEPGAAVPAGPAPAGAGDLLALVRLRGGATRGDLGRLTGLSRTAVAARVGVLVGSGLLETAGTTAETGGRPAETLVVNADAGRVVALAVGRSRSQVGVVDLLGSELAGDSVEHTDLDASPERLLPELARRAAAMAPDDRPVLAVGLSVPGSVDLAAGRVRESLVLPAWDGVDLRRHLGDLGTLPLALGNDADVLASAELATRGPVLRDALVLKLSTGLGVGLVVDGAVAHGHRGAAGELGHVRVTAAGDAPCRCGGSGCLETLAAGWALLEQVPAGEAAAHAHTRDLVAAARRGDARARALLRTSALHVGEALAAAVNLLDPEVVVVGGDMGEAFDLYAAGLREAMWPRLAASAARGLRLEPSRLGERAGLVGAATVALDRLLEARAVDAWLERQGQP